MNLDQYIEGLTKEAAVNDKLEKHLKGLVKKASVEAELEHKLTTSTAEELAKMAGIELPEGTCPRCAGDMQKLGSVYQCRCGMVKKASKTKVASDKIVLAAVLSCNGDIDAAMDKLAAAGFEKVALGALGRVGKALWAAGKNVARGEGGKAVSALKGAGRTAVKGAKRYGEQVGATFQAGREGVRQAGRGFTPGTISSGHRTGVLGGVGAVAQRHPGLAATAVGVPVGAAGLAAMGGEKQAADDSVSPGVWMSQAGMGRAMRRPGSRIFAHPELIGETQTKQLTHGLAGGGIGAGVGALGGLAAGLIARKKLGPGAGAAIGALGGGAAGLMGGTVHGAHSAQKEFLGKRGITPRMLGFKAKFSPEAAKKYFTADELAEMRKTSSAEELISIGDAAGRLMAKTALEIEPSEVTEAIQGAQEREDIPGRARKWGMGGAALGGLGGGALGAGAGLGGMLLAKKFGLNMPSPGIQKAIVGGGGAAGAVGGGLLGHRIGAQEGAEEAAADKLVSMIRGRRAYLAGGDAGYQAGALRGFMAGRQAGNPQ